MAAGPRASDLPIELVDRVGHRTFRLERRIGRGGFGSVFLATVRLPSGLEQRVAVKILHRDLASPGQPMERLLDEARMLTALNHPVILAAQDLVRFDDDQVALVTEFVDGKDLKQLVLAEDPIPLGPLLDVAGQVAGALHDAWTSHRIVHRDIKPENIRIGRHGNVKVLDFGIARADGLLRAAHTSTDAVLGSLGYVAPERFERGKGNHPAVDVFALGCVLYHGIVRNGLFRDLDFTEFVGLTHGTEFDRYVDDQLRSVPDDRVAELLAAMLRRHPDRRPTAAEVASRCEQLLAQLPEPRLVRTWCRSYAWEEARPDTELVRVGPPPSPPGRESSGSLAPAATLLTRTSRRPARPVLWVVAGATVAAAAALGVFGSGAVGALALWRQLASTPSVPTPDPVPAPVAVEAPAPAPPAEPPLVPSEPSPGPPPAPVQTVAPTPAPTPSVDPAPSGPAAAPPSPWGEPPAARVVVTGDDGRFSLDGAAVGATNASYDLPLGVHRCELTTAAGRWSQPCEVATGRPLRLLSYGRVSSADRVHLQGDDGVRHELGSVPSGSYGVYADFGSGEQFAGRIAVAPGAEVVVRCNPIRASCGG